MFLANVEWCDVAHCKLTAIIKRVRNQEFFYFLVVNLTDEHILCVYY